MVLADAEGLPRVQRFAGTGRVDDVGHLDPVDVLFAHRAGGVPVEDDSATLVEGDAYGSDARARQCRARSCSSSGCLFAGVRGRQIAGRFTLIASTPFAYGTTEQRTAWRSLIASLEAMLRLHNHRTGTLVALDEYLYRRSSGMIGSLSQLVRGAAILAIEDGTEQITRDLLDLVPVDFAAEKAARPTTPRQHKHRTAKTAAASA